LTSSGHFESIKIPFIMINSIYLRDADIFYTKMCTGIWIFRKWSIFGSHFEFEECDMLKSVTDGFIGSYNIYDPIFKTFYLLIKE